MIAILSAGILIAASGSLWLVALGGTPPPVAFMAAVTVFLGGMGLINPIGSAITLEPFGHRAGAASALLGFLQMGLAAFGTALIGALPFGTALTLGWIMLAGTVCATISFYPMIAYLRDASTMREAGAIRPS